MPRAQTKTRAEWADLEMRMRSSGMTPKAWCEAYGINLGTMRTSIRRRKKSEIKTTSPKEIENTVSWIEAVPIVTRNISSYNAPNDIQVISGGYAINVPVGFDRVTFIDICKALSSL